MIFALHGLTVRYSNIVSDVRLAKEAGYDALELHTDKLDRYLASGLGAPYLADVLDHHGIQASGIDIIGAGDGHPIFTQWFSAIDGMGAYTPHFKRYTLRHPTTTTTTTTAIEC